MQTTLMDVLAGRKTGGIITGDIRVQVSSKLLMSAPALECLDNIPDSIEPSTCLLDTAYACVSTCSHIEGRAIIISIPK